MFVLLAALLLQIPDAHTSGSITMGNELLAAHKFREAMTQFESVLTRNPGDMAARSGELAAAISFAVEARGSGDSEAALLVLRHAREYLPDDLTLLLDLGIQAEQMHRLDEASEALNTALKLTAEPNPKVLYALARVETDQDHLPAAEAHFRAYLAVRPDDATAHFGLGQVAERQQHIADAQAEFRRSIELQPLQTESYYQLGQMALDDHRDTEARQLFEKTLARDSAHGGALTGLGILEYRAKAYAAAREHLTRAIDASPSYQPAHYYLGLTLARLGETAASQAELKRAVELAQQQQGKGNPIPSSGP